MQEDTRKKNIIYEYRVKNWLKQAELAEEMNKLCVKRGIEPTITKMHISYWENGLRVPRKKETLKIIADTICVELPVLIQELRR